MRLSSPTVSFEELQLLQQLFHTAGSDDLGMANECDLDVNPPLGKHLSDSTRQLYGQLRIAAQTSSLSDFSPSTWLPLLPSESLFGPVDSLRSTECHPAQTPQKIHQTFRQVALTANAQALYRIN